MAVSYPDAMGEFYTARNRFVSGGLQYAGYFEPKKIAPGQVAYLFLFVQNNLNVDVTANFQINIPEKGGFSFLWRGKPMLKVNQPEIEVELTAAEAGLLTIPVTTTAEVESDEFTLTLEVNTATHGRGQRVRSKNSKSALDSGALINDPVGLDLVASLGSTYVEQRAKKAPFTLKVVEAESEEKEDKPNLKHTYETIWTPENAQYFNQAVHELNLRQAKLRKEMDVEKLYVNLYGESVQRFADAGVPLRIGEAITIAKILTFSCQYFLSNPDRANGLLVPIWERALEAEIDTTDSLNVLRTAGFHHIVRLSVAISFGLMARAFKRHLWSLTERRAVANHIADNLEMGQPLDIDFLYLPLLMGGTHISDKITLHGEDLDHSLALIKKAREARKELFTDQDMAKANKVYNRILTRALQ